MNLLNEITKNGYCLTDILLSNSELENISRFVDANNNTSQQDAIQYSLLTFDALQNKTISAFVLDKLKLLLAESFKDYMFYSGSYLTKAPYTKNELSIHQDWSYVDESKFHAITCWIPLVDVDMYSGTLAFIKGSHVLVNTRRSHSYESARFRFEELLENCIEMPPIKKGQVVLFDSRVWHGSAPNFKNQSRTAITGLLIPQAADFCYYHKKDEFTAQIYKMPTQGLEAHLCHLVKSDIPTSFILLKEEAYQHSTIPASLFNFSPATL